MKIKKRLLFPIVTAVVNPNLTKNMKSKALEHAPFFLKTNKKEMPNDSY